MLRFGRTYHSQMHPRIFREFETVCREHRLTGSALEVGAIASNDTLLCMPALDSCVEKVGINLSAPASFGDFTIVSGNANEMTMFGDDRFDVVLCNALLEHDPFFWLTVAEMKRVLKPGGLIVVGVPAFRQLRYERHRSSLKRRIGALGRLSRTRYLNPVLNSTLTYEVHAAPQDYYRFSEEAMSSVILDGMNDISIRPVMIPPRLIGWGTKP